MRLITGIVLHNVLAADLRQGLQMMKYATNHPWRFSNYKFAYFVGLL